MNLYEINGQILQLAEMLEAGEIDETIYTDTVQALGGEIAIEDIIKAIRNKNAEAEALKAEADAKQAEAEAKKAEIEAAQEKQEYYQRMVDDIAKDRDYYKNDRDEQRKRQDEMEEQVRNLQRDVARNGRMVEALRPFICTDLSCKLRKRAVISENGEVKEVKQRKKQNIYNYMNGG